MLACTLSLLSFSSLTNFLPSSWSTPVRTVIICSTLSRLSARMSTPRLASLLIKTSLAWSSLNSSSAYRVSCVSACSTRASDPLKSKRLLISLFAWSTALRSSTRLTSETISKLGMSPHSRTVQPQRERCDRQAGAVVELGGRLDGVLCQFLGAATFHVVCRVKSAERIVAAASVSVEAGEFLYRAVSRYTENAARVRDQDVHARGFEGILFVLLRH